MYVYVSVDDKRTPVVSGEWKVQSILQLFGYVGKQYMLMLDTGGGHVPYHQNEYVHIDSYTNKFELCYERGYQPRKSK